MKRKLAVIQPAMDWSLWGTSAWLNLWPGRKIDGSGHARSPHAMPSGTRWELAEQAENQPATGTSKPDRSRTAA
jgi:hypothetical protein